MIRIVEETDTEITYEVTQVNDLLGDTSCWNDEDWTTWKEKMDRLEKEGTKGQLETFTFTLNKNPFSAGGLTI